MIKKNFISIAILSIVIPILAIAISFGVTGLSLSKVPLWFPILIGTLIILTIALLFVFYKQKRGKEESEELSTKKYIIIAYFLFSISILSLTYLFGNYLFFFVLLALQLIYILFLAATFKN